MKSNGKNQTTKRLNTIANSLGPASTATVATTVPTIPNVTPDAAPLLIEAVKLQKKYNGLQQKLAQNECSNYLDKTSGEECFQKDCNNRSNKKRKIQMPQQHKSVQESIFARIDASVKPTSEEMMLQEKKEQIDQVLQSLLNIINKNCRDIRRDIIDDRLNNDDDEDHLFDGKNCAIGCLDFVLELIQDDKAKIILRHAALCVCRYLLWYRCDCRCVFTRRIKSYVDAIGDADGHLKIRPNIGTEQNVVVYQREGLKLIQDLYEEFRFAQPTLVIAARYLEEQKGISMVSSGMNTGAVFKRKTNAGMTELRRIRDIALKFTDQEVRKIQKILFRVDRCFEILVPRFGHAATKVINRVPWDTQDTEHSHMIDCDRDDDDDGDDDDVDWEDGMEQDANESQGKVEMTLDHNTEDHLVRVERTLAIMKQSGALSSDGTMNVSFGTYTNPTTQVDQSVAMARQLLPKNMDKLLKRQERIVTWMDALVSADNMIEASRLKNNDIFDQTRTHSYEGTSSLVLLPEPLRKMKPRVLRTLTECRSAIAAAISAASKIEIKGNLKSDIEFCSNEPRTQDGSTGKSGIKPFPSQSWQDALGVKKEEGIMKGLNNGRNSRTAKKPRLSIQIRRS